MKYRINKSYYKSGIIAKLVKAILLSILLLLIFYSKLHEDDIKFLYGFTMMDTFIIMYFVLRLDYINKNIKRNNAELTNYSNRIISRYKLVLCLYIVSMIIYTIISIFIKVNSNENIEVWIWFGLQMPMMYCDAVYLSGITAFGDKAYCSGVFVIKYSIIKEFKEIMYKSTYSGEMVLIDVLSSKGVLGYDKFFVEEYHELRLKVFQNNS